MVEDPGPKRYNPTPILLLAIASFSLGYLLYSSQNRLKGMQSELEITKEKLQATQEELWSIHWEVQSIRGELSSTEANLSSYASRLRSTVLRLSEMEERLKKAEGDLRATESELERTATQLEDARLELKATRSKLSAERGRAEQLEDEKEILESEFGQLSKAVVLSREITWADNFLPYTEWSYIFRVNRSDYITYMTGYHPYNIDYKMMDSFITTSDPHIQHIVRDLDEHYDDEEKLAEHALAFVQSLFDEEDIDNYPKYPIETLVEGGGDCEDASILYATIMKALGFDVALLDFPEHVMVGVAFQGPVPISVRGRWHYEYEGKRYYPAETTGQNWRIGDISEEDRESEVTVYPL